MLTARGVALCGVAVAAWTLGRFLGVDELYVVSAAAVAMVVLAIVSTRVSSARIAVRRHTTAHHTHRDERLPIEIALRNDGRLPASLLLVEDRRPSGIADDDDTGARFVVRGLRPRRLAELRWHAIGRRRGRYAIGPVRIRVRDPFGLAERSRRYRATDDLVVFPPIEPLPSGGTRGIRHGADTSASQRAFHHGDEFHTMRNYLVGDDLRYVHWPSTAHRGELMVRQHELPWQARAVVYLDSRTSVHVGVGDRSTLERGVSAAASVLSHLDRQRYEIDLVTGGSPPGRSDGRLERALIRLAELGPVADDSPAAILRAVGKAGSGLLVAVVRPPTRRAATPDTGRDDDLADHAEVRALLQAGRGYRTRVALIVEHTDAARCGMLARLLRLAGWRTAVAPQGTPLADVWHHAMIGADVGRFVGSRR
ncbi:MAG TPA: DUF58 domain-containing protein [Euzebyales bacterium]|nr:DUF58 domain-containing protein [Euzebyales bacterium]